MGGTTSEGLTKFFTAWIAPNMLYSVVNKIPSGISTNCPSSAKFFESAGTTAGRSPWALLRNWPVLIGQHAANAGGSGEHLSYRPFVVVKPQMTHKFLQHLAARRTRPEPNRSFENKFAWLLLKYTKETK